MAWAIQITRLAKEDVAGIKKWYKKKSLHALNDFTAELTETIEELRREDVEHKPVHDPYRRVLLKKFPYTIYYRRIEENHAVEIGAVFHNHRDSDSVTGRFP